MRLRTYLLAFLTLLATMGTMAANKFTLVIDAGHGGKDTGAPGKISVEKNINLKVALAFGKYVENNCSDVRVIYTRTTDVFVELQERANIANRNKADLFISIHTNALDGGKISRGFETYTLGMHRAADNLNVAKRENSVILIEKNYKQRYAGFDPKSSESYIMFELMQDKNMANSVELAKLIQSEVCTVSGRVNKGVHQAGFLVLRETSMPSCLVELGFITTSDEEQYLNTKEGQDKMARGIYQAFLRYKKKYGNSKLRTQDDSEPIMEDDNNNNLLAMVDNGEKVESRPNDTRNFSQENLRGDASQSDQRVVTDVQEIADDTEYSEQRAVRPVDAFVSQVSEVNEMVELLGQTGTSGREMASSPPAKTQNSVTTPPPAPAPEQKVSAPETKVPTPETKVPVSEPKAPAPETKVSAPEQKVPVSEPKATAPETKAPASKPSTKAQDSSPKVPLLVAQRIATEVKNNTKPPSNTTSTPKPTEATSKPTPKPAEATPKPTPKPAEATPKPASKPATEATPTAPKLSANNRPSEKPTPETKTPQPTTSKASQPTTSKASETTSNTDNNKNSQIVFKVQIVASSNSIPTNSDIFKGVQNINSYTDNGMVKYTVGETTDFEEIGKLKKEMTEKFPQAFIVAFKEGQRMDISKALKEYRNLKNNR